MAEPTIDVVVERVDHVIASAEELKQTLGEVHKEVKKTNGRVTALEYKVKDLEAGTQTYKGIIKTIVLLLAGALIPKIVEALPIWR